MKNIRSSYKDYKNTTEEPVSENDYIKLNYLYNKFLIAKVLQGHEVTLPSRLGTLSVIGRKQRVRIEDGEIVGLAPDWVKTKILWDSDPEAKKSKQLLYHTNPHSDGVRYKYTWSKKNVLVENKTLYSLRLTRCNKRALSSLIKQGVPFVTK